MTTCISNCPFLGEMSLSVKMNMLYLIKKKKIVATDYKQND